LRDVNDSWVTLFIVDYSSDKIESLVFYLKMESFDCSVDE